MENTSTIRHLLKRPPVTAREDDDLALILQIMRCAEVRHLPFLRPVRKRSTRGSASGSPSTEALMTEQASSSETNRLDVVIPSLVDAMFTGFPGRNGETVKITIPTRQQPRA